jgi:hypothetical protein
MRCVFPRVQLGHFRKYVGLFTRGNDDLWDEPKPDLLINNNVFYQGMIPQRSTSYVNLLPPSRFHYNQSVQTCCNATRLKY